MDEPDLEPAPGGDVATILDMQRRAGNAAVTAVMTGSTAPWAQSVIQRKYIPGARTNISATWDDEEGLELASEGPDEEPAKPKHHGGRQSNIRGTRLPTLRVGDQSGAVQLLTEALSKYVLHARFAAEDHEVYTEHDCSLVKWFQGLVSLTQDGIVGPKTWAALDVARRW